MCIQFILIKLRFSLIYRWLIYLSVFRQELPLSLIQLKQVLSSACSLNEHKFRFPDARIFNAYGPTETCIYASCQEVTDYFLNDKNAPIAHIEEQNLLLDTPEIIICSEGVATGYLENEKRNQEKFIQRDKKRAFRTGDLFYIKNKYIYFDGRNDEQVKLNGYRIEPDEIKEVIEHIKGVEQAECIPIRVDGHVKRLIAFLKWHRSDDSLSETELKIKLAQTLPAYMIPSEFIIRKDFPYNTSYKIDKQKLLEDYLNS